jgi:outer membrane protein
VKKEIFALFACAFAAAFPAAAQTSAPAPAAAAHAPVKVGVIEIQAALASTKDGQKAMQEFNARMDPKKKELDRKAQEIRDLQDRLQRGGDKMADAAKQELQRNIDRKTTAYNRDMQDLQAEAQEDERKVLEELSGKMTAVIDKYAQANGYSVIIDVSNPNSAVLYASASVNITKDIVELYDKSTGGATTSAAPAKPSATPAPAKTTPPAASTPAAPPAAKKQP